MDLKAIALITMATLSGVPSIARAVDVESGEHNGFSRLVFPVPSSTHWSTVTTGNEFHITLSHSPGHLNTSRIFDRIPKDRISKVTYSPRDRTLSLTMECACEITVELYRSRFLVVDTKSRKGGDKNPLPQAKYRLPGNFADLNPRLFPQVTHPSVWQPNRSSSRAAATLKPAEEPIIVAFPKRTPASSNNNPAAVQEAETRLASRGHSDNDQPELVPATLIQDHIMTSSLITSKAIDHIESLEINATEEDARDQKITCARLKSMLSDSGGIKPNFAEEIGRLHSKGLENIDEQKVDQFLRISTTFLRYGMGAEAISVQKNIADHTISTRTIFALSSIIQGQVFDYTGESDVGEICPFAQKLTTLTKMEKNVFPTDSKSIKETIATYKSFPKFLQIALSQEIYRHLHDTAYKEVFERISQKQPTPDTFYTENQNQEDSTALTTALERTPSLQHETQNMLPREAMESLIREARGTPAEVELKINLANSLVSQGEYLEALAQVKDLRDPEESQHVHEIYLEISRNADDLIFLRSMFIESDHRGSFLTSKNGAEARQRLGELGYDLRRTRDPGASTIIDQEHSLFVDGSTSNLSGNTTAYAAQDISDPNSELTSNDRLIPPTDELSTLSAESDHSRFQDALLARTSAGVILGN